MISKCLLQSDFILETNNLVCSRDPKGLFQMQKEPGGRHLSSAVLHIESSVKQAGGGGCHDGESRAAWLGWVSHGDGLKLLGISSQKLLSAHQNRKSTQGRAGVMLAGGCT